MFRPLTVIAGGVSDCAEIPLARSSFLNGMTFSPRAVGSLLLVGILALAIDVKAADAGGALPPAERIAIEALIARVEAMKDATFVRNGKAYPPATAGKFLRGKWQNRADSIRTADEFIEKVATASSTTGRPYVIRFADGRETPTATFLRTELRRIRKAPRG